MTHNITHIAPGNTLIITVWLGSWPGYLKYFLKSIGNQQRFKWLIVSDQSGIPYEPDNVLYLQLNNQEINDLFSLKLGFPVEIKDSIKLCDLKPCFGRIFDEYLDGYDYWGYSDLDLILGNLEGFLNPILDRKPDIVSFYGKYMSGPICLYRNTKEMRELYKQVNGYKTILQHEGHYAFDENNSKAIRNISIFRKNMLRIFYFLIIPFNIRLHWFKPKEIRYGFQWFMKRQNNHLFEPADMTDLVLRLTKTGEIHSIFKNLLHSDREFKRMEKKRWKLKWEDGILSDEVRQKELPGFHFVDLKNEEEINTDLSKDLPENFILTEKGFSV